MPSTYSPEEIQEVISHAETVLLEDLAKDDLKCQFKHRTTECSIEVVAIIRCSCQTTPPTLICEVARFSRATEMAKGDPAFPCWCGKQPAECWIIVPI